MQEFANGGGPLSTKVYNKISRHDYHMPKCGTVFFLFVYYTDRL